MYYAKYGSGLLRVSMSYAYQGVNGKQTLHPRFPGDQGTPFPYKSLIIKRLQQIPRIQWVAWRTVPVTGAGAKRFRDAPIPWGTGGELDAKKYQVPPRFPRLRGGTWPIVNSWVKFFPWGTGEGVPFWACQAKSTCGHSTGGIYFWSVSASSGLCPIPATSSKIDTRPFRGDVST